MVTQGVVSKEVFGLQFHFLPPFISIFLQILTELKQEETVISCIRELFLKNCDEKHYCNNINVYTQLLVGES